MNQKVFCDEAVRRYGHQEDLLEDADCGVHIVMSALANLIRTSLIRGKIDMAKDVFNFIERTIQDPSSDTENENAVWISFLQIYDFEKGGELEQFANILPTKIAKCLRRARGV